MDDAWPISLSSLRGDSFDGATGACRQLLSAAMNVIIMETYAFDTCKPNAAFQPIEGASHTTTTAKWISFNLPKYLCMPHWHWFYWLWANNFTSVDGTPKMCQPLIYERYESKKSVTQLYDTFFREYFIRFFFSQLFFSPKLVAGWHFNLAAIDGNLIN